jgi:hypothetical protein
MTTSSRRINRNNNNFLGTFWKKNSQENNSTHSRDFRIFSYLAITF